MTAGRRISPPGFLLALLAATCLAGCHSDSGQLESADPQALLAANDCPDSLDGSTIRCYLDRSYQGPFGGDAGDFPVTRIDTYWTDGGQEEPKNCSSVLGNIQGEAHADGSSADPQDQEHYRNWENKPTRKLDIYVPSDAPAAGPRRVLFWVHGGAWADSTKEMYSWIPKVFTGARKWITVVTEYREVDPKIFSAAACKTKEECRLKLDAGELGFMDKAAWYPDAMQDVADAFSWTVQNIAAYGGDANDIYIAGQSAGGNLVSMLALHADYASVRSRIRGVVTMSPPSDPFWLIYGTDPVDVNLDPPQPCGLLYRALFNNFFEPCTTLTPDIDPGHRAASCTRADLDAASPTRQIVPGMADLPDFLVMQGGSGTDELLDRDMPCLKQDVDRFVAEMEGNGYGARVTSRVMDGYGHASSVASLEYESATVEPERAPFGDYGDYDACYVPLGPEDKTRNVTEWILNWIECRQPSGC
ncbi:MAG: alpha/beta hydrolase [bacterium]